MKAIEKFIAGSGLTNVLIDGEILAGGSVNSFLTGKNFNCCKIVHPELALALHILHLEMFLESQELDLSSIQKQLE